MSSIGGVSAGGLEAIVCARVGEPAATWFVAAVAAVRHDFTQFGPRWSGAGRRLGRNPVALTAEEKARVPFPVDGWGLDELGRVLLLTTAMGALPVDRHVDVVEELYRTGELREQQAVVKALAHLPEPARFVAIAVDSVRSNALSLLEAIACDNPYPGSFFPDGAFNQMVMKALFNALPLSRISGFDRRRTEELVRMVRAWASERRAAGRTVPADAARIIEGGSDASV